MEISEDQMQERRLSHWQLWRIFLVSVVLLVLLVITFDLITRSASPVTPDPKSTAGPYYTELYFSNVSRSIDETTSEEIYSYTFTVVNREGSDTDYTYDKYLIDALGETHRLGTGTLHLENGQSVTGTGTVALNAVELPGTLVIALPLLQQVIRSHIF